MVIIFPLPLPSPPLPSPPLPSPPLPSPPLPSPPLPSPPLPSPPLPSPPLPPLPSPPLPSPPLPSPPLPSPPLPSPPLPSPPLPSPPLPSPPLPSPLPSPPLPSPPLPSPPSPPLPSSGLVLLTDGVSGFQSPGMMHAALNHMREANISCWVVQVGGSLDPSTSFGLMPDSESLRLMTEICNGCLLDSDKVFCKNCVHLRVNLPFLLLRCLALLRQLLQMVRPMPCRELCSTGLSSCLLAVATSETCPAKTCPPLWISSGLMLGESCRVIPSLLPSPGKQLWGGLDRIPDEFDNSLSAPCLHQYCWVKDKGRVLP